MPPRGIVEALDVVEHVGFRLLSGAIRFARGSLGLERGEEAFHCRVVPHIARATHAAGETLIRQEPLEQFAGVLAALIRVMQSPSWACLVARSPSPTHP